jgi:uncharacterized membrane-anchored protein
MKKYRWMIILLNLVLIFGYFTFAVVSKEKLLSDGKLILLELAPKDSKSILQGDYMQLNYKMTRDLPYNDIPKRGYCVVKILPNGVGERVRLQKGRTPLNDNEWLIEYTNDKRRMNIGAESYFFQEGEAAKFGKAKYGGLKVDKFGNSVLVGLYDQQLREIQ